jgi:hypothetical protein
MGIARDLDADLFVALQDYTWLPCDGLDRFVAMAEEFPTCLLAGLCSMTDKPGVEGVADPEGLWSIFHEPYDGRKPSSISWLDCRLEIAKGICPVAPMFWEANWAAIPRRVLHDTSLDYDVAYDRGHGYDNQDYAYRAVGKGYGVWIDTANHAIELPHRAYFPVQQAALEAKSNREWHEGRVR